MNPAVNAVVAMSKQRARQEADEAGARLARDEPRGPLDLAAVALLARRMTALTQRVGQAAPASTSQAERLLEADGI